MHNFIRHLKFKHDMFEKNGEEEVQEDNVDDVQRENICARPHDANRNYISQFQE